MRSNVRLDISYNCEASTYMSNTDRTARISRDELVASIRVDVLVLMDANYGSHNEDANPK